MHEVRRPPHTHIHGPVCGSDCSPRRVCQGHRPEQHPTPQLNTDRRDWSRRCTPIHLPLRSRCLPVSSCYRPDIRLHHDQMGSCSACWSAAGGRNNA